MPHITLTEEQLRVITEAGGPVEVHGPGGQLLGSLTLFTPEDLEAIERYKRTGETGRREPGVPSARVQAFLQKLHDIADREGIDEPKVKELLHRVRVGEPL